MYSIRININNRSARLIVNYDLENLNLAASIKVEVTSMLKTFIAGDEQVTVTDDGEEVTISCAITDSKMYMEAANQAAQIEELLKENYN